MIHRIVIFFLLQTAADQSPKEFKTSTWWKWIEDYIPYFSYWHASNEILSNPAALSAQCFKIIWLKTPWNELPKPGFEIKSPAELAVCLKVILLNMQLYLIILAASWRYRKLRLSKSVVCATILNQRCSVNFLRTTERLLNQQRKWCGGCGAWLCLFTRERFSEATLATKH